MGEEIASLRSQVANLRAEWTDTLGSLVKIGNKMNAQNRRDLKRAADDGDDVAQQQLTLHQAAPAAPLDRGARKAQLRARLAQGARSAALLLAVALAYAADQVLGLASDAQLAFLPGLAMIGRAALGTSLGKRIGGAVIGAAGKVFGARGTAVATAATGAVTRAAGSKLARRAVKAGAGAVAAGGAFEAGSRVVRGGGGGATDGAAVFGPGTGMAAGGFSGGGLVEVAPGIFSDGKSLRMEMNGRMRRISGFDVFGQPKLRRPQMNVLNPQALGRANRRLVGFGKFAKKTLAQLAAQSRKFAAPGARGGKRTGHKAGCKCATCR